MVMDTDRCTGKISICRSRAKVYTTLQFNDKRDSSIRFGAVRFGSVRFGSVRFGSVRFASAQGSLRLYSVKSLMEKKCPPVNPSGGHVVHPLSRV